MGINRNIVECKWSLQSSEEDRGYRINRNIVECKGPRSTRNGSHVFVLIETLWNVKSHFTRDDSVLSLY